jgi:hypothetical protein
MTTLAEQQSAARALVAANATMQEAITVDPMIGEIFDLIIRTRLDWCNRWDAYSHWKELLSWHVGWGARNPALGGTRYYDAMIPLIDAILPLQSELDAESAGQWDWMNT